MSKVQLVTFKGCQSTIDFRTQLEGLIETEKLDVEVEMARYCMEYLGHSTK